jgi:DNA-binding transcriptional LysR family regulator
VEIYEKQSRNCRVYPIEITVNTSEAAVEAAVAGGGIAQVMSYKMEAARRAGTLAVVLEELSKRHGGSTSVMRNVNPCLSASRLSKLGSHLG